MSTPVGKGETFPALVAHSLSRLLRWHIASPPSLCRGNTGSLSRCSMDFMPVCLFFGCLPPMTFANPSCSISPCPLIQCSCAFASCAATCLLCHVRHCLYCHTRGIASFLLCKGRASVMLQGSQSLLVTKKFQRFWGAVAPGPNSLRP